MVLNIDVFRLRVEDRVAGQPYGSLVIAFQWDDDWRCFWCSGQLVPPPSLIIPVLVDGVNPCVSLGDLDGGVLLVRL